MNVRNIKVKSITYISKTLLELSMFAIPTYSWSMKFIDNFKSEVFRSISVICNDYKKISVNHHRVGYKKDLRVVGTHVRPCVLSKMKSNITGMSQRS